MNLDKHHIEKRHNKRFLGTFFMFSVFAVAMGVFLTLVWMNMNESTSTASNTNIESAGASLGGTTLTGTVTYQGVLNMMNRCLIFSGNTTNTTCNDICKKNFGTCTAAYVVNISLVYPDMPVSCGFSTFKAGQRLFCNCCSTLGNEAKMDEHAPTSTEIDCFVYGIPGCNLT